MATFKGKDGVVKSGANAVAEVRSFTIEEKGENLDDSVMGDDWRTRLPFIKDWSGSVDVLFDDTDTNGQATLIAGASISLSLQMEGDTAGDHKLSGTALITGRNITASYDGLVEASISFEGNGALTEGTVSA
jgi:predicted secreted protein